MQLHVNEEDLKKNVDENAPLYNRFFGLVLSRMNYLTCQIVSQTELITYEIAITPNGIANCIWKKTINGMKLYHGRFQQWTNNVNLNEIGVSRCVPASYKSNVS